MSGEGVGGVDRVGASEGAEREKRRGNKNTVLWSSAFPISFGVEWWSSAARFFCLAEWQAPGDCRRPGRAAWLLVAQGRTVSAASPEGATPGQPEQRWRLPGDRGQAPRLGPVRRREPTGHVWGWLGGRYKTPAGWPCSTSPPTRTITAIRSAMSATLPVVVTTPPRCRIVPALPEQDQYLRLDGHSSAVVGSSAIRMVPGLPGDAMATFTRCRMPPRTRAGNCRPVGRPAVCRRGGPHRVARAVPLLEHDRCAGSASSLCQPTRFTGFSESIVREYHGDPGAAYRRLLSRVQRHHVVPL